MRTGDKCTDYPSGLVSLLVSGLPGSIFSGSC